MSDAAYFEVDQEVFPFTVQSFRGDTGELLWERTVTGPGAIEVPGFGSLGVDIGVRFLYNDGSVYEEVAGVKVVRHPDGTTETTTA